MGAPLFKATSIGIGAAAGESEGVERLDSQIEFRRVKWFVRLAFLLAFPGLSFVAGFVVGFVIIMNADLPRLGPDWANLAYPVYTGIVAAAWAVLATLASAFARQKTGGLTLCIILGLVVGGALYVTGMIMLGKAASTSPIIHALRAELLLSPGLAVLAFLAAGSSSKRRERLARAPRRGPPRRDGNRTK